MGHLYSGWINSYRALASAATLPLQIELFCTHSSVSVCIAANALCERTLQDSLFISDENLITEDDIEQQYYDEYDAGGYSPRLLRPSDLEPDQLVYDPEDDIKRLEYARNHVMKTGRTVRLILQFSFLSWLK